MSAVRGMVEASSGRSGVILCGREYMNSLADSSMEEVKQSIREYDWLNNFYEMGENYIRTRCRRVSYVFSGLRHNLDSIKSKARILLAWIDEAENVSEIAWQKLDPTVREDGSEIWVTWNPESRDSPTDQRFWSQAKGDEYRIAELQYWDNPFFPEVLEKSRQRDQRNLDDATYRWIWEGAYRENSAAQIFAGKYAIEEFEPGENWVGPYQGLDFGFSQDPTAAVRMWINDDNLYVEHEAGRVALEIDETAKEICAVIPGFERYITRADSARPESISFLKRKGMPRIMAAAKGKGSVEDGIAHIRGYKKVIIHPRCSNVIDEFRRYSYKTDRMTGDVLTDIVDAHNHYIDAMRYGLEPVMRMRRGFFG